jgi:hypothetical protein
LVTTLHNLNVIAHLKCGAFTLQKQEHFKESQCGPEVGKNCLNLMKTLLKSNLSKAAELGNIGSSPS